MDKSHAYTFAERRAVDGTDWRARIYGRESTSTQNSTLRLDSSSNIHTPHASLMIGGLALLLAVLFIPLLVSWSRPAPGEPEHLSASSLDVTVGSIAEISSGLESEAASQHFHPDVESAVTTARRIAEEAERTERRALAAAERAEQQSGAELGTLRYSSGDAYWGEVVGEQRHGVGLYAWAGETPTTFAGQFRNDVINGLGVKRWGDGAVFAGSRDGRTGAGFGVFRYADGRRFEGQWQNGVPNGLGAVWSADGLLAAQGVWTDNRLVAALDRNDLQ